MKIPEPISDSSAWDALHSLVLGCEVAFTDKTMEWDDDTDVSSPPMGVTFGMIRRAREAYEWLRWDGVIRGK